MDDAGTADTAVTVGPQPRTALRGALTAGFNSRWRIFADSGLFTHPSAGAIVRRLATRIFLDPAGASRGTDGSGLARSMPEAGTTFMRTSPTAAGGRHRRSPISQVRGLRPPRMATSPTPASCVSMLQLRFDTDKPAAQHPADRRALATTSRSAAAAPCCNWSRTTRRRGSPGSRSLRTQSGARENPASGAATARRKCRPGGPGRIVSRKLFPRTAGRS